ncbi:MAG: glycogen/starch/alpha-glucan family phosphorylase [Oscillospiraceae bacterium]|nr:glycogen/starch/alpha-glucan family phosphorylase [Oscillospiraceae bacterium]
MKLDQEIVCRAILADTQSLLKLRYDVTLEDATAAALHDCLCSVVMLRIGKQWSDCEQQRQQQRHACYFSAEYLLGRLVYSNLFNLGLLDEMRRLLAEKGVDIACLEDVEDAALGNGGLGRLAACYLDSAATLDIPLTGYGLRYKYGLFHQSFDEYGNQCEAPEEWARFGDAWGWRRETRAVRIDFADQSVRAVPYDVPVIGYRNDNIGTLRLWQCEALNQPQLECLSADELRHALDERNRAENITHMLYPDDRDWEGKRLRIKQQYVLSSASLQDILRTCHENHGDLNCLPDYVVIQLNDTHPALSIPELIRLLQREGYDFDGALALTRRVFAYTNHTVMAEALEKWDVNLLESVAPELVNILRQIEARLQQEHPGLSIFCGNAVSMADLCVYLSTSINGVAGIHSEIIRRDIFKDWYAVYPERFKNVTNGITPRRWLGLCNPELTALLEERCGRGFLTDLPRLASLRDKLDGDFIARFNAVKRRKKEQLAAVILQKEGIEISPDSVFDVQIKRLHEYKRQLMNALCIMDIYFALKEGALQDFPATTFLFGAKAATGYDCAKSIIRYINRVARKINADPDVNGRIRVVFVQNYNCSYAEHLIPAADISEQISPAGTEASGTSNMKFMLNGAVTLGMLDGANVEIVQEAGAENEYIFGATIEDITRIRSNYRSRDIYETNERVRRVVDSLVDGTVETDDGLRDLWHSLLDGADWHSADHYYILYDLRAYMDTRRRAIYDWRDRETFGRKCLLNVAAAGKFSADRAVREYADHIWHI